MAWGRKPARDRGRVEWKDRTLEGKPAPFAQNIPRYRDTENVSDKHAPYLVVGALWTTSAPLEVGNKNDVTSIAELTRTWYGDVIVPKNSLLVYAGTVRRDEREKNGRIVSVPRHTFIAAGARYMVIDFGSLLPVV